MGEAMLLTFAAGYSIPVDRRQRGSSDSGENPRLFRPRRLPGLCPPIVRRHVSASKVRYVRLIGDDSSSAFRCRMILM